MDVGKSLQFMTEDDRWVTKFLIAAVMGLFAFLIIPALFLAGYSVALARNVMAGEERPLPEWDAWGDFLKDGFMIAIAMFVYTLPIILIICCASITTGAFSSLGEVSEGAAVSGIFASLGLMICLVFIFIVALFFITPAIYIQYIRFDNLGACFQFGEILNIVRENIGDIVIILVVTFGINLVLNLIAGILPIIGLVIALAGTAYVAFVAGHLYGQLGAKIGGAPKEEKFAG